MASYNNGNSYSSGEGAASYSYDYASPTNNNTGMRRRTLETASPMSAMASPSSGVVKRFDFMFPKVESEYTVKTDRGGMASLVALGICLLLCLAEIATFISQNKSTVEHISVDTSLGKRMRVNINITFPELACVDLHVDVMDVAGDSQLNVEDTLVKLHLHKDGTPLTNQEVQVDLNKHQQDFDDKQRILKEKLPQNYCGPCFGAHETDDQCCQTCDEVLDAYKKKSWNWDMLQYTAEQCIREGRDHQEPKRMTKGMGCNLSGYMTVNRVAGNFHIAMGEGVERDGRHIHSFVPEDAPNFNASHIIHQLTFGPGDDDDGSPLNGLVKIVGHQHGTTGLFQYFIKIVPTTYKDMLLPPISEQDQKMPSLYHDDEQQGENHPANDAILETNRYFYTERFRPLLAELEQDERMEDSTQLAQAHVGGAHHEHHHHHAARNAILPGVFFMYEIYPFAVEITCPKIPFTHLLIRILATFGGVFTMVKWADAALYARDRKRGRHY
jgi:predicted nucleic acid-binding Zn ribbon protein